MMRAPLLGAMLTLGACGPQAAQTAANLQDCGGLELSGGLAPAECQFEAAGRVVQVRFAALAQGERAGRVEVSVLNDEGAAQQLVEGDVDDYLMPSFEDVDGDGRADILIPRASGAVNTEYGVWIFDGQRYNRVGQVSGVDFQRTADGYIAVPARSSADSWNVAFYRLDGAGLHALVTAQVDGEQTADGAIRSTCTLSATPGLSDINLDTAAAQAKFCAEPAAAGVFGP